MCASLTLNQQRHHYFTWTWLMAALTVVGVGLIISSHTIDQYLWRHGTLLLGGAATLAGIHGMLYAGTRRRIVDLLLANRCPLCQWALSHLSVLSQFLWFAAHLLRLASLALLFGTLLAFETTLLWMVVLQPQPEWSLSSGWLWPFFIGLGTYLFATLVYIQLDMRIEAVGFYDGPSDIQHNHRSSVADWIAATIGRFST